MLFVGVPKGPKRTWMKVYKPFEVCESTKMTWRYAMNAFYAFWSMIDGNLRHFFCITYSSYSNICICFSPAPWKSNKAKTLQNAKSIIILPHFSVLNDFNLTYYPKSDSHFFTGSGNITFKSMASRGRPCVSLYLAFEAIESVMAVYHLIFTPKRLLS